MEEVFSDRNTTEVEYQSDTIATWKNTKFFCQR